MSTDHMGPPCIPSERSPHWVSESDAELIGFLVCVIAYSGCVFAAGVWLGWGLA